ncbi:cytochrome P450 [Mycena capillaripes]|nr:cytochrome P450 [Mycena capillaripes]
MSLFLENIAVQHSVQQGIAWIGLISTLAVFWFLRHGSTIHNIPGPPSPSWLFGHMFQLLLAPTYGDYEFNWLKMYGPVYKVNGCFGQERLMVSDPTALQYILNSSHFQLTPSQEILAYFLYGKKSVLGSSGKDHKRLRAALNPGFSAAAVRNYRPIFEKAAHALSEQIDALPGPTNICPLLSVATISSAAEATLGYSSNDLGEEYMSNNFQVMALSSKQSSVQIMAEAIAAYFPAWLSRVAIHLPTQTFKIIRRAKYLANEVGKRVIREKRDAARLGLEFNTDLYGQLVELHDSKNTLTEDEIVEQTALLMIAGQDTTANTLTFGLLELAKAPELQAQLRAEIHSIFATAGADGVAYDSMPLLNAFIKELLRFYPAESIPERSVNCDTVIPLADNITTSSGTQISEIPVRKGQIVLLGVATYHRLESRWGDDAMEFKPSRWLNGTTYKGEAVGPYANLLSFFGGPHTCLGWRFALLEMQVLLCELVGKFSFSLPMGKSPRIGYANTLLPIMSNGQKGAPLCIKRVM